jgi:nucleoside-diphosphate-sugar epimerase
MIKIMLNTIVWGSGYIADAYMHYWGADGIKFLSGRKSSVIPNSGSNLLLIHSNVKYNTSLLIDLEKRYYNFLNSNSFNRVVFISTVGVYGLSKGSEFKESDVVKADCNYSKEKINLEKLIENYCIRNKKPYYILRVSNVYGHVSKHIYPRRGIFKILLDGYFGKNIVNIEHGGRQHINYIHIKDLCIYIYKFLNFKNIPSGTYNIGSESSIVLKEIIKHAETTLVDIDINITDDKNRRINSIIDIEKLKCIFGEYVYQNWQDEFEKWKVLK